MFSSINFEPRVVAEVIIMGPAGDEVQCNKVDEAQHHRGGVIMEENV